MSRRQAALKAGLSPTLMRSIETGITRVAAGTDVPASVSDESLAAAARVVRVTPAELTAAGRAGAARALAELLDQQPDVSVAGEAARLEAAITESPVLSAKQKDTLVRALRREIDRTAG